MKSHHWTGAGTEWQRLPRPKKADIVAARRDLKQTRFLADESVEVAVAVLLRRQGFNVGHTSEAGMRGHPDENSFPYAAREDRVLLTRDTDFLDNHAFLVRRSTRRSPVSRRRYEASGCARGQPGRFAGSTRGSNPRRGGAHPHLDTEASRRPIPRARAPYL